MKVRALDHRDFAITRIDNRICGGRCTPSLVR